MDPASNARTAGSGSGSGSGGGGGSGGGAGIPSCSADHAPFPTLFSARTRNV